MNAAKQRSRATERGVWAITGGVHEAAALTRLGFDWVALDAQHGRFDDSSIEATLAARRDDAVPIHVRVRAADAGLIGRALDAGAAGVIVPMVSTPGAARDVVEAALYPPLGARSWGPFLGASDRETASPAEANVTVRVAAMIETRAALDVVNEIAAVMAIAPRGALFVGPFDLAIALGVSIDELLADTKASAPLPTIVRAAETHGLVAGAFAGTPERAGILRDIGFTFLAVATDELLSARGARSVLDPRDSLNEL